MKKGLLNRLNQDHAGVLSTRNQLVVNQAKLAQEALLKNKESVVNSLQLQLEQMTDLAPENTTSLTVKNALSENPNKWVEDVHELSVQLELALIQLRIAKKNYDEMFPSEEEAASI